MSRRTTEPVEDAEIGSARPDPSTASASSALSTPQIASDRKTAAVFKTLRRWVGGIRTGDRDPKRRFTAASWLFLRGMGLVYLFAFASLWSQFEGLIGDNGILPVGEYLDFVESRVGDRRFQIAPTLAWLDPSSSFLNLLCGAGVVLSVLVITGVAPLLSLVLLWAFYLSLSIAGQQFFQFQWDSLLLEAGLLAVFMAPLTLAARRPIDSPESPRLAAFLVRFLLFKLMLLSGIVKLLSKDETWSGLTALTVHYETQPLPHGLSWWAHHLPNWMHTAGTGATLGIELIVPFFVFGPRILRHIAFFAFTGLMLAIGFTGNYGFFNLLTWVLCLMLLDDDAIRRWLPLGLGDRLVPHDASSAIDSSSISIAPGRVLPNWVLVPVVLFLLPQSAMTLTDRARVDLPWPRVVKAAKEVTTPFRSVNGYGLFASMTTVRREIVIEGSHDGRTWVPYEFRWKPGDVDRRPALAGPHMPRVDWQMWFAALGNAQRNPWLVRMMDRLLEGRPEVLDLLDGNPFPDAPPRFVRALIYDYRFTDKDDHDGVYWRRELLGLYVAPRDRPPGMAGTR